MSDVVKKIGPLSKAMARQMTKSWEAPQFSVETDVDCTAMIAARTRLPYRPSYTTLLIKCTADALREFPALRSSWTEEGILEHEDVNIGVAVDTRRGLLVPVVQGAADLSLEALHEAMQSIKAKSEKGNFAMEEMSGSVFTISNLGMFDVISFKAIVNAPEAAILAVSKMAETPVVRDGVLAVAKLMRLTLSADHRVTDGATCARFLGDLKKRLESL